MRSAKVYARVFSYAIPDDLAAGSVEFTVEWKLLSGTKEGGKAKFVLTSLVSDDQVKSDLRDALATYLSARFAETIQPRDIVGYSA